MSHETPERAAVRDALDALKPHLGAWLNQQLARKGRRPRGNDIQAFLGAVLDNWDAVFDGRLSRSVRHYVFELKEARNRWAHEESFTDDEARRAADTARLIAKAIRAPDEVIARITFIGESLTPGFVERRLHAGRRLADREKDTGNGTPVRQRDVMRRLYASYAPDIERVVREYAAAERRGHVQRARNTRNTSAEDYARRLVADGMKKGWLAERRSEERPKR